MIVGLHLLIQLAQDISILNQAAAVKATGVLDSFLDVCCPLADPI